MFGIDPKFQKWVNAREAGRKAPTGIPTRNSNPTLKAGPKNSTGPKGGSAKSKAVFNKQKHGKG